MLNLNLKSGFLQLVFAAFVMNAVNAHASEHTNTYVGKVSYKGTACPKGSVKVSLKGEKSKLSVTFRDYSIQARGRNARGTRKSCSIAIPLHVPEGWSVSLVNARYHGNLTIPEGGQGRLVNTYSFSGKRGNSYKVNFDGPRTQKFQLRDSLSSLASVWSSCGKKTVLRINSSMRVKSSDAGNALATESTQSFETKLRFRRCYK